MLMSYNAPFGLPDFYHWALLTLISAGILTLCAAVTLIWSLLSTRKFSWFSWLSVLLLGIGIWSLFIALTAFRQLAAFGDQLLRPRPHHITPDAVRTILGTAYGSDLQRCQIQFGLILAALLLLLLLGLWQLLNRSTKRRISGNSREQANYG